MTAQSIAWQEVKVVVVLASFLTCFILVHSFSKYSVHITVDTTDFCDTGDFIVSITNRSVIPLTYIFGTQLVAGIKFEDGEYVDFSSFYMHVPGISLIRGIPITGKPEGTLSGPYSVSSELLLQHEGQSMRLVIGLERFAIATAFHTSWFNIPSCTGQT